MRRRDEYTREHCREKYVSHPLFLFLFLFPLYSLSFLVYYSTISHISFIFPLYTHPTPISPPSPSPPSTLIYTPLASHQRPSGLKYYGGCGGAPPRRGYGGQMPPMGRARTSRRVGRREGEGGEGARLDGHTPVL